MVEEVYNIRNIASFFLTPAADKGEEMQSKTKVSRLLSSDQLAPLVLQVFGLGSFLSMGIFWAITDRISAVLLAGAFSLVGAGTYVDAVKSLPNVALSDKDTVPNGK